MPQQLSTLGAAAVQLRISGASFDDVATTLGLSNARDALRLVTKELALQGEEDDGGRDRLRKETSMQLEACIQSLFPKASNPEHDEHIVSIRTLVSVLDRRAKLHGLDAPTQVTVHNPTQTEIDQWVALMVGEAMIEIEEGEVVEGEVIE